MNLLTYNLLGLKPKAFGLEIENCSVKAVYLEKKRNNFRLVSCGKKIMPRGIVQSEQIINSKKLAEEIKFLFKTTGFTFSTDPSTFLIKSTKCG